MTYQVTERGAFVRHKLTAAEVLARISKEAVKFVDLQFTDVPGRLRHVTLPSEMVHEGIFRDGVAKLDGSSVKGFVEIHESDMMLVPDLSSFGIIPWLKDGMKTARMICDRSAVYSQCPATLPNRSSGRSSFL